MSLEREGFVLIDRSQTLFYRGDVNILQSMQSTDQRSSIVGFWQVTRLLDFDIGILQRRCNVPSNLTESITARLIDGHRIATVGYILSAFLRKPTDVDITV